MRPNKTNFGLSFGHFGGSYLKGEEEKEEEEQMYGIYVWRLLWYGSMELGFCMETMLYGYMTLSMENMS